jgi:uncharacterized membrane protein (DUF4010 family)
MPSMPDSIIIRFILALLLGAFIGLEREVHENNEKSKGGTSFLGVRTFTIITILGTIAGYLYPGNPIFFTVLTAGFAGLVLIYYALNSYFTRDIGITTEITLLFSYVIGFLLTTSVFSIQLIIAMTIVVVFILSRKKRIREFIDGIGQTELGSFISYLLIALVILPLLPDRGYSLSDIPQLGTALSDMGIHLGNFLSVEIVNPFKLWRIVALITGVDVFGYILERSLGQKSGWLITSFAGGFVSSTATTQSLAQQSKKTKSANHLVAAALISNISSFFQEAILILPLSGLLFTRTLPILISMIAGGTMIAFYFLRQHGKHTKEATITPKQSIKRGKLFSLKPALTFAGLFLFIKLISQVALQLFGSNGFLLSIGFGAIPGIDAVLISLAELSGNALPITTAVWAFLFANAVNLITKTLFSFSQGSREFAIKFAVGAGTILIAGIIGLLAI